MIVQMLIIVEMRDRYALAECLQAYAERLGPLLGKTQGLHAAYLAGEGRRVDPCDRDAFLDEPSPRMA